MDESVYQESGGPDGGEVAGVAMVLGAASLAGAAPSGHARVEQHQHRDGHSLHQSVAFRRDDGSTWTAYSRQVALPADAAEADLTTRHAHCVLDLLARAVAAAESARCARGVMLEWTAEPPPWFARYGVSE